MTTDKLKKVIEKTAPISLRNNQQIFKKLNKNNEAYKLWKKYSSGDTGDDLFLKSLALDDLSPEHLEQKLFNVSLILSVDDYIKVSGETWIKEISILTEYYKSGEKYFNDFFAANVLPINKITLCRAIFPIFYYVYVNIKNFNVLSCKVIQDICLQFFEIAEPICNDTILVSIKRYYNTEKIDNILYTKERNETIEYLDWLYNVGIEDVILDYPVCFRCLIKAATIYIQNINKVIDRIICDKAEIETRLFGNINIDKITCFEANLSDCHNGSQTVCKISFDDSHTLIYKPRSMKIDIAWNLFLHEFREICNFNFELYPLKIIDKEVYGYVEYLNWENTNNAKQYYKNAGVIMCLVSLFGGSDFHYENIIAKNTIPVLIDLETLITPLPQKAYSSIEPKDNIPVNTVGKTLLLPRWVGNSIQTSREIGGFTSQSDYGHNYLIVNGNKTSATQNIDEVIEGYSSTYKFIMKNKDELIKIIHSAKFDKCKFRYVFRRTALYYSLYRHFLHAAYLKDSLFYEAVISRIGAGIVMTFDSQISKILWSIVISEKEAIKNGDIPYFYCIGDERAIITDNEIVIKDFFEMSPLEIVKKNLASFSNNQLRLHLQYIKNSLLLEKGQSQTSATTELLSYRPIVRQKIKPDNAILFEEVKNIFQIINNYRISELDFEYYAPVRSSLTTRYNLDVLDDTYYSGIWGVLLFQAAYSKLLDDMQLKKRINDKILELTKTYFDESNKSIFLNLGIAQGVAGTINALICLSKILDNNYYENLAFSVVEKINYEYIDRCKETDFFGGLSGLMYVCYKLYKITPKDNLKRLIEYISNSLVDKISNWGKTKVWETKMEYAPITGLAHGQSGYAIAMGCAYQVLRDDHYFEILRDVLMYEQSAYSSIDNNWFDYRKFYVPRRDQDITEKYNKRFMHGYCSGAPGVGLSRIVLHRILDEKIDNNSIFNAVKYCMNTEIIGNDSLCCGSVSWIDFLIEASIYFKNSDYLYESRKIAMSIIPRNSNTKYVLSNIDEVYDIALFKGLSGIGYELIRTILPDLPSPLA